MARKLPSLNALKTFEAAARRLSFTEAANELCVTQAAVSRQIRLLEEDLNVALFRRMTRAIELTEEGQALLAPVSDALDQMERAAARIWNRSDGGLLTISVLPTFSVKWLMPRLLDFSEEHPNIEIHLVNSIKPVDFNQDDIDLAIRVGSTGIHDGEDGQPRIDLTMVRNWNGVRAEKLLPDELIAVAAPGYLPQNRYVESPRQLANVTLLQMATRPNAWPDYFEALGWTVKDNRAGPSFGHFFMALQAAIAGRGVALLPLILVQDDLRDRRVVRALPDTIPSAGHYHLLGREGQWTSRKVTIFREWLNKEVSESRIAQTATSDPAQL